MKLPVPERYIRWATRHADRDVDRKLEQLRRQGFLPADETELRRYLRFRISQDARDSFIVVYLCVAYLVAIFLLSWVI